MAKHGNNHADRILVHLDAFDNAEEGTERAVQNTDLITNIVVDDDFLARREKAREEAKEEAKEKKAAPAKTPAPEKPAAAPVPEKKDIEHAPVEAAPKAPAPVKKEAGNAPEKASVEKAFEEKASDEKEDDQNLAQEIREIQEEETLPEEILEDA